MITVGISAINRPYPIGVNLQIGRDVYVDRGYTYTAVTSLVQGASYIQTANNDKTSSGEGFLTFTLDQPSVVYVAHDVRITPKPSWLASFTDTGEDLVTSDTTLRLFSKPYPPGQVSLGGNGSTGNSMYAVIISALEDGGHDSMSVRGMFDSDSFYGAFNVAYTRNMLKRLKAAGFNAYFPEVWVGRGSLWPSSIAPWDLKIRGLVKAGSDPLKMIIDEAHNLDMQVHPWIPLTLRLADSDVHPEYAPPGTPSQAFDVHNQSFRQFIADLVGELAYKHDVDGINLDYVRTMGISTSQSVQDEFYQISGKNLLDVVAEWSSPGGVGRNPEMVAYQEQAVTAMVEGCSEAIRSIKPHAVISVDSAIGQISVDQGSNPIDWVNRGVVDQILRMDYGLDLRVDIANQLKSTMADPTKLGFALSNVVTDEKLSTQLHTPRDGAWLSQAVHVVSTLWPESWVVVYFSKYFTEMQSIALSSGPWSQKPL